MLAPPVSYLGFRLLLLALIIAINAFFAASEVALLSVRESRLRQLAEQGQAGARVALALLGNPEKLLSVTQIGVTLASLGLGWAGEDTLYRLSVRLFQSAETPAISGILHAGSFALAFLVMTYFHVVIGEVVPKNLAIEKADRLAIIVAPALMIFYRISAAFVYVIERSAGIITTALGVRSRHRGGGHSTEEIKLIVSSSRTLGHLPQLQEDMIHRVLDAGEILVREIMIPRNDIISVSADASLDEVLRQMTEHQHSRLPVYETRPEDIAGILYFKDLLPVWQQQRVAIKAGRTPRPFRLRRLMRKHLVAPETKPVLHMLNDFRVGNSHMAMIVDEFGTIVGMITVEDVLEQIVGEIEDEFDEKRAAISSGSGPLELDGAISVRDLEMQYGIELPADAGFETLAGYILFKLGHIPRIGEIAQDEGRRFTVTGMERNRITRILVERPQ